MENLSQITEKKYPIQIRWVLKSLSGYILGLIFVAIIFLDNDPVSAMIYLMFFLFSAIFVFIQTVLRRQAFHYTVDDAFLKFEQGVLSKKQRHIPYGVVQNLFVKQDLYDRLFGLASLTIENASQGGGIDKKQKKFFGMSLTSRKRQKNESVGFDANKVLIPGLNKGDAEVLKSIILQKMKDNPIDDNQSGL
ncbi:MAG: PH domain-containing protein [Patescibacteria group bacterium]